MKFMQRMIQKYFTKPNTQSLCIPNVEYCVYCGEYVMKRKTKDITLFREPMQNYNDKVDITKI
jgi:hypothetical protein